MFNYYNVEELKAQVVALQAENKELREELEAAQEEIDFMYIYNRYE